MQNESAKRTPEAETEGGFNPDRPNQKPRQTVGPLPTDDPHGKAKAGLKTELENEGKSKK